MRPLLLLLALMGLATPAMAATRGVTPSDIRFTPGQTLSYGSVGVPRIAKDTAAFTGDLYPGAVVLAARNGVIVTHSATGYALRYADASSTELPRDKWIPMRPDTIFDLASISKLFTTVVALQQVEQGRIALDRPVAGYLPGFAQNGKGAITIRQLLTHTSGLEPDLPFFRYKGRPAQEAALYAETPRITPGSGYIYSDLNLITLQFVLEKVTGKRLDALVHDGVTAPLGLRDTVYNPAPSLRPRIAATEYEHVPPAQLDRGLAWGQVHDENAYALGGVAGHAGVFSTAHDLAVFAQMILDGGRYGNARILREDTVRLLFTDVGHDHALGFELNQPWYMDTLSSPVTAGHTGYTGTSIVIDPISRSFVILLTNNVHPSREGPSPNPARRAVAHDLATAIGRT
jgi:CubicO group peptidase (beta-lactamase class C family)